MSVFSTLDTLGVLSPNRGENILDGGSPYYRAYETADGKHVSVAAIEPHFFAEMLRIAELPPDLAERSERSVQMARIERYFGG